MTEKEAKVFLDNLKVCIEEHPIVADWLVEIADRKSEPQTLDDIGRQIQDAYDKGLLSDADAAQAWYEAVKTEPQTDCSWQKGE